MLQKIFEYTLSGLIESGVKAYTDFVEVSFNVESDVDMIFLRLKPSCRIGFGVVDSAGVIRGWGADRRYSVYIAKTSATPGFVPGPIVKGVWKVLLRIDKSAGDCSYSLEIKGFKMLSDVTSFSDILEFLSHVARSWNLLETISKNIDVVSLIVYKYPCRDFLNTQKVSKVNGWFRGDLHTHTIHSDGRNTVCELLALARSRGLDFIALTDHNTVSQNHEAGLVEEDGNPIVIPGTEVTTFYGHINIFNIGKCPDFRIRSKEDFEKLIDEAHRNNALVSVNHPSRYMEVLCPDCPFIHKDVRGFDAIEIWNGPWYIQNSEALRWWHNILVEGHRVTAVGGSDFHGGVEGDVTQLGEPTTWVYAKKLDPQSIVDGIKRGWVYITYKPNRPVISIDFRKSGEEQVYMFGDAISVGDKRSEVIEIVARIENAKKSMLRIISSESVLRTIPVEENIFIHREAVTAFDICSEKSRGKFIRIEVGGYANPHKLVPENNDDMFAITNPVYVKCS
ncbi:CehA/McbA family metallohydrolase [Ignisphaera sp. 4213-co]|uniref:CehA/McbA family metallohydrolase n=1 Tax=Ignisphaera cupida TaxID=3050454 RepID=A0ABD4Z7Z4_9CREN|nr:CehA/McbA family metallohydrolase [Ignisphaera sp. 4213-co]MDK6028819.1 CehA/McbA family metallohydrolase [Ignisphaera sp. 4213-co]